MKKIITKPHLFFFGLTLSFIILGFINRNESLDFNIGDTYYIFTVDFWFYISAIFFTLIGFNYFSLIWAEKPPKKWLTILHLSLQMLSLLLLMTKHHWNWVGKQYPKELSLLNDNSEMVIFISFVLFMASILIHLINFFVPLFLKKN
ncbi:hypothetical protein CW731_04110 [Polaribacter sp. ALD11]|uniref:hypothetical protein n=1 Tax=Polaribacter sp. ALD11 TaxID=2058137 RepID=UPI000C30D49F|nr:hypothetical protein [Polaribacter sp. ALD11]AUC84533.1 hypothetical protein CW731_04110 [Polaribacter sp. ALD11]